MSQNDQIIINLDELTVTHRDIEMNMKAGVYSQKKYKTLEECVFGAWKLQEEVQPEYMYLAKRKNHRGSLGIALTIRKNYARTK